MTQPTYDKSEVIRTLNLFIGKGNIAEIRILNAFGARGRNDSGYFDNFAQAAGALQGYATSAKNPGIYFVLNPFVPELMARAANRFQERASDTTQDADIVSRRWFFIDCDPKRKTGISATDTEWQAAKSKAEAVAEWLKVEHGFCSPIFASSGNGFHLHYRIDVPADDEHRDMIKSCLRAIAAKFDDNTVTIDTKVFNAARICKLYGTMARKGDHTDDRPHRLSQILSVPESLDPVCPFAMMDLAKLAPPEKVRVAAKPEKKRKGGGKTTADRARAYLQKVPGAVAGESGHDWTFHAAALLVIDFNLSIDDAMPLLLEWNETCQPPWSESELMHKLESVDALPDDRGAALKSNREKWEQGIEAKFVANAQQTAAASDAVETSAPAVAVDPLAYDRKILKELGIAYCCETDNSEIEVFSNVFRKFSTIRDSGKLTYSKLLQFAGPPAARLVRQINDDEGKPYSLNEVKNALAIVAGAGKRGSEKLGQGIWRLGEQVVLVNGDHVAIFDGTTLSQEKSAVYNDHVFDVGSDDQWFDFEQVAGWIDQPNRDWVFDVMLQLCRILEQWCFKIPDKTEDPSICAEILASLIVASWIQSFWTFRPMTFLLGESNSGKSTLFELLIGEETDPLNNGLMGSLAIHSSNQSAAGIRQSAERSSRPVFVDELEKGKHRAEILELLRGASRGSQTIRGTAGQKAITTKLAFMAWAASTESGLMKQVDQNRWIQIQMATPTQDKMGKLKLPSVDELTLLRNKLIAASVVIGGDSREMVDRLMQRRPKHVDHRICQIFAVPAAVFACMTGLPMESAVDSFTRMLKVFDADELEKDQDSALDIVLTSKVRCGHTERSLLSLIQQTQNEFCPGSVENEELLAVNGVKIISEDHRKFVFINPKIVSRELTKNSSLDGVKVGELLMRLPGAERSLRRISGKPMRGIVIPIEIILPPEQADLFTEV